MSRITKLLGVAAALLAAPLLARAAGTATGTFQVTANVPTACTIRGTNITVAAYDPNAATAATGTGTVTVQCTRGTTYTIGLDSAGKWTLSDGAKPTANTLNYSILQGATTTPWNATSTLVGTATSRAAINLTATASIPTGQDVPVGTYTDTVTMTVNY